MVYRRRSGFHIKADAQTVGEVCEGLSERDELTPQALVDESRPEDAPLHGEFEWNDSKAAEMYRCTQASYIIRSVVVVPEATERPVRAFVSLENAVESEEEPEKTSKQQYHRIDVAMRREDSRKAVLAQAFKELAAFRRKYMDFIELADVFAAIDSAFEAAS